MKSRSRNTIAVFQGISLSAGVLAADFRNKTVQTVCGTDGRPCTFFTLEGVSSADPLTPSIPWLVLRQNSSGYKENLALLISAKIAGRLVHVTTNGVVAPKCGAVESYVVMLP